MEGVVIAYKFLAGGCVGLGLGRRAGSSAATARAGDFLVASIYVPNGNKDYPAKVKFLEALAKWAAAERQAGTKLILCGDLNVAREERDVHPKLRRNDQIGQTPAERVLLEAV